MFEVILKSPTSDSDIMAKYEKLMILFSITLEMYMKFVKGLFLDGIIEEAGDKLKPLFSL